MKSKYKVLKKLICALLIGTMILPNAYSSYAEENVTNSFEVKFSRFKVELNEYSNNTHYVEYEKLGSKEIAHIKDKNGVEVDTFELNLATGRSHNETLPLTRYQNVKGTKLKLEIYVNIYIDGSFREVLKVTSKNLSIENKVSSEYFESKDVDAWKDSATKVGFSYNGTLACAFSYSISPSLSATLYGAGFSLIGTVSGTTYFRKNFSNSGSISLY